MMTQYERKMLEAANRISRSLEVIADAFIRISPPEFEPIDPDDIDDGVEDDLPWQ